MNHVLFIAYQIPPISGAATQRHLRFLAKLELYNYSPIVLTIKPEYAEDYYHKDYSIVNRLPKNVDIEKTISLNPMDKLLIYKNRFRKNKKDMSENESNKNNTVHFDKKTKIGISKKIKDFITEIFRIPDRQIGWYLFAIIRGIKILKERKIKVIYSSGSPWTSHLIGVTLSKVFDIPWVADFRDPWTQNPYKEYPFKIIENINKYLEKKIVMNAKYVICNTLPLKNKMQEVYREFNHEKFVHISNGYWEPLFNGLDYNKNDKRLIMSHVGTIYSKRNPNAVFLALSSLKRKGLLNRNNFLLKMVGGRGKRDINLALLKDLDIEELVEISARVNHHEALNAIAQSDILLLIQPDTKLQIPGKLFEYIAVGHPVLAIAGEGATSDIVKSEKLGFVVNPEDTRGLEKILFDILNDYQQGKKQTIMNLSAKEKYESKYLTKKLVDLFNKASIL